MQVQFEQVPYACLTGVVSQVRSQEQTQEIRLESDMPDVGKVLGCYGQVVVRGKEWRGSSMTLSGGVTTWVLYGPADGTPPRSVESWIPFRLRWDFPQTQGEARMVMACSLQEVDARVLSDRKLLVRYTVSCLGEAWEPGSGVVYRPQQVPEDVELLRKSYPICLPREAGEKAFSLEDALTIPPAEGEVEEILSCTIRPEVSEEQILAGRLVFRGQSTVHLVYRSVAGRVCAWEDTLPFSQHADLEGEHAADAAAWVVPEVTALETAHEGDGRVSLKGGITCQYLVYDRPVVEIVADAYSPSRSVEVRREAMALPLVLERRRETVTVAQPVEDGMALADGVVRFQQPQMHRLGEEVELSLEGSCQILGYDADGQLQGSQTLWQQELRIPAAPEVALQGVALAGTPSRKSLHQISAEITVALRATGGEGIPMVTALELGQPQEPDENRPSLILRRCPGEGLWRMAKEAGSTPAAIVRANQLEGEPEPGRLLIIPIP